MALTAAVSPLGAGPAAAKEEGPQTLLERARDRDLPLPSRVAAARAAVEVSHRAEDVGGEARARSALGGVLLAEERYAEALEQFHTARRLFEAAGDSRGLLGVLRRTGDAQYRLGSHELALRSYLAALDLAHRLVRGSPSASDRLMVGHLHAVLGNVHRAAGDPEQARADYEAAEEVYRREGYVPGRAGMELNVGNLLDDQGSYGEAMASYSEALTLARAMGNLELERMVLTNRAGSRIAAGELEDAEEDLRRAAELVSASPTSRSRLYLAMKRGDLLMAQRRPREAAGEYRRALREARSIGDADRVLELHGLLADALLAAGDRDGALHHLLEERKLSRRQAVSSVSARIPRLRIAYEAERREQELALLQARQAAQVLQNRLLVGALGLTAVLFLTAVWGLRSTSRAARTIALQRDELETSYRGMEELSRTDELTGLPNRRHALERLEAERSRLERSGGRSALALADLDGFKAINDGLGHAAGDLLLQEVAAVLAAAVRSHDLVARWGGDELLLLFPDTTVQEATAMAQRLLATVREADFRFEGVPVAVSLCLGVAPCAGTGVDAWLRAADAALYRAKARGAGSIEGTDAAGDSTVPPEQTGTAVDPVN